MGYTDLFFFSRLQPIMTGPITLVALHPGQHLVHTFLTAMETPLDELARALGVSETVATEFVLGQRAVDLDLAMRLERAVGLTAQTWLNLQTSFDLAHQPELTIEHPPLESFYWGKPVASFLQTIPSLGWESSCLVTCSFTSAGRLVFTLSQNDKDVSPSLSGCVEDHAVTALSTMLQGTASEITVHDTGAFEHFKRRLSDARDAAFRSNAFHLEALSLLARIDWLEHYLFTPNSGECCLRVSFKENRPDPETWCYGEQLFQAVDTQVRHIVRQALPSATK